MNTSTATPYSIPQGTPAAGRAVLKLLQGLQHGSRRLQERSFSGGLGHHIERQAGRG